MVDQADIVKKTLWAKRVLDLPIPAIDPHRPVSKAEIALLRQRYHFAQIVNEQASLEGMAEAKIVVSRSGWDMYDYGDALSTALGGSLFSQTHPDLVEEALLDRQSDVEEGLEAEGEDLAPESDEALLARMPPALLQYYLALGDVEETPNIVSYPEADALEAAWQAKAAETETNAAEASTADAAEALPVADGAAAAVANEPAPPGHHAETWPNMGKGTIVQQVVTTAEDMIEFAVVQNWAGVRWIDGSPLMRWAVWMAAKARDVTTNIQPSAEELARYERVKGGGVAS